MMPPIDSIESVCMRPPIDSIESVCMRPPIDSIESVCIRPPIDSVECVCMRPPIDSVSPFVELVQSVGVLTSSDGAVTTSAASFHLGSGSKPEQILTVQWIVTAPSSPSVTTNN